MDGEKVYFLDLQTLLTYLSDQSCTLTAELKIAGKTAKGRILLKEGKIAHCLLTLHNGQQIIGEEALKRLQGHSQWQVYLETSEEKKRASFPPPSSPQTTTLFPTQPFTPYNPWHAPPLKQKRPLDPSALQSLPARERLILRTIFTMIDGKQSSEDIKAQLHLSSEDIDVALRRLRMLDLIE